MGALSAHTTTPGHETTSDDRRVLLMSALMVSLRWWPVNPSTARSAPRR